MKKIIRLFFIVVILEGILFLFYSNHYWKYLLSIDTLNGIIDIRLIYIFPIFIIINILLLTISFIPNVKISNFLIDLYKNSKWGLVTHAVPIFFIFIFGSAFFISADNIPDATYKLFSPVILFFMLVGYQILILFYFIRPESKKRFGYLIGLPLVLASNYFLRHTLEGAGEYLKPFFSVYLVEEAKTVFSSYKWWQLLLPIKEFTGVWNVNLILTHFVELAIGASATWYLFNALLIIFSFFLSWDIFHSKIFSYTFAICMGFGTQLYHSYQVFGSIGYYLLYVFFISLIYCNYKVITTKKRKWIWKIVFLITLILTTIQYEGWLDLFVFIWLASIYLFFLFHKHSRTEYIKRLLFLFISYNAIAAIYIYMKFTYIGFIHTEGMESDVVFNYPYFWPIVEDVISNYFTHMYIVLTNFFPPPFMSSNSLYYYGAEELIRQQFGYHVTSSHLVPHHYIFLWRYFAGVIVVIFIYFLVKVIKETLVNGKLSNEFVPLSIFMIMTAVGGPTHTFVKFRPMNSMPFLGYHVLVGVMGFSLVISYLLHIHNIRSNHKKGGYLIQYIVWSLILYSSIMRPKFLWHMNEVVGLSVQGPYPNPIKPILQTIMQLISR